MDPINLEVGSDGTWHHTEDPGEPVAPDMTRKDQKRTSVHPEELRLLQGLAACKRVLEIGTGVGVSARGFAQVSPEVVSLDPDPWVHEKIWPLLRDCPTLHCYDDRAKVPSDFYADFIFIDGLHTADAVKNDLEYACTKLSPEGMIVLHDTNNADVMAGAMEWLFARRQEPSAPDIKLYTFPTHGRIGFLFPY